MYSLVSCTPRILTAPDLAHHIVRLRCVWFTTESNSAVSGSLQNPTPLCLVHYRIRLRCVRHTAEPVCTVSCTPRILTPLCLVNNQVWQRCVWYIAAESDSPHSLHKSPVFGTLYCLAQRWVLLRLVWHTAESETSMFDTPDNLTVLCGAHCGVWPQCPAQHWVLMRLV